MVLEFDFDHLMHGFFQKYIHISLTASNLKKIMETVTEYYSEILNITLTEFICPNIMKIAEKSDQCELGRLLQLILGTFQTFFSS